MDPQVIVGESIAGRAATVRRSLMSLVSSLNVNTFDLADLFYEAQENSYYSAWGFASLSEYAAQELGLKERKAQYLARITKVCRAVGLKRAQYEQAGVSKLREICTLDPEKSFWNKDTKTSEPLDEHIVRLILDSDKLTVEQTKEEVGRLKGQSGADRQVIRSCGMSLSTWENVVKPAYELARMKLGSAARDDGGNAVEYSDGVCLEVICAEFLADPNNAEEPVDSEELTMEEVLGTPMKIPMEEI